MFPRRRVVLNAVLSVLSLCALMRAVAGEPDGYPSRANPALSAQGHFLDERIAEFMEKNHLPGMTMAIVQAPYVPRSAGYGRASAFYDELASTKTMWNIGPITQAFTAVAVFQLAEAHKLDIHDRVVKYVHGLPESWQSITLYELLQHASGIPDFRDAHDFSESQHYQPMALINLVRDEPLLFASGTQVRNSATDFVLLGLVIERASGMSYHDYITRYQIAPLGLRSTRFASDIAAQSLLDRPARKPGENQHVLFKSQIPYINPVEPATGYRDSNGALEPVELKASESLYSYGGLWSSAEDISTWDIALAGSALVKSAADRAIIYESTRLESGAVVPAMAGWEFTHHTGFMEIKGNAPGFSAYLSRFTAASELVCVTLLTNKEGVDLTGLARDIAESYQAGLGSGLDSDKIVTRESKFGVDETVARLEAQLDRLKIPVFATFNHTENAMKSGLQLRPTQVIVFGNAKVGTQLMLDDQPIALDLPLRVSIWEDARGQVWVGYRNPEALAASYGINDPGTVRKLDAVLQTVVSRAVNVYEY